jgi:hypothetical protein
MGNRAVQAGLVVLFLVFGVVAAYALNGAGKKAGGATANGSPSAASSPSASPSEAPSASPSAPLPSPSEAPTQSPTAAPAPAQSTQPTGTTPTGTSSCTTTGSGGSGPPGYPRQVSAGASYQYCGSGRLIVDAVDGGEGGSAICAGIEETTQAMPGGYRGAFFVGIEFRDGKILSAGYIKTGSSRTDFASLADGAGTPLGGNVGGDPGPGGHTYCVSHTGSGWTMTRDGSTTIFTTAAEAAANVAGATVKFDSQLQPLNGATTAAFGFTIPGFHDITDDGAAVPGSRLRGRAFYA